MVRGVQDWFAGKDRLLVVDLPVKGEKTIYAVLGDSFAWLDLALLALLCLSALGLLRRKGAR
jgi:apolipoprotein N-acyltransferase